MIDVYNNLSQRQLLDATSVSDFQHLNNKRVNRVVDWAEDPASKYAQPILKVVHAVQDRFNRSLMGHKGTAMTIAEAST